jgi:hypothetical protein
MVAGIIAGKPNNANGINGANPGSSLAIVKVFGNSGTTKFWKGPAQGLDYVASRAAPCDVVNLSWGASWTEVTRRGAFAGLRTIEDALHRMASNGVRVVVAAGQPTSAGPLGWTPLITPANARLFGTTEASVEYPQPTTGTCRGGIYVVAASRTTGNFMNWVDTFPTDPDGSPATNWGQSPPDFAEPGIDIQSYWKSKGIKRQTNICSGTSFAAPHLAGLLVRVGMLGDLATAAQNTGPGSSGFTTNVKTTVKAATNPANCP